MRIIQELKSLDLLKVDIDRAKAQLAPLMIGYGINILIFDAGMHVFRGNIYEDKPTNRSKLTYPPAHFIKKFQRANRPGSPMFYCSGARNSPFFELKVLPSQCVSISKWRTTERAMLSNVGYHQSVFDTLKSNRDAAVYKELMPERSATFDADSVNYTVQKFLAEEFAQDVPAGEDYKYKLSAIIAESLLGNVTTEPGKADLVPYKKICGIMYPALAMSANADNIALTPEFVEKFMVLEQVEYLRIDDVIGTQGYRHTSIDFANSFSPDGTIEWKGRPPQWTFANDGSVTAREEDGETIFRNKNGDIIPPY